MKKTTKILLVLAAVVAMTIGAVSTVMAADDYATIGAWSGDEDDGYTATDVNGDPIVRGWAQDNGRWYFFDSSKMLSNAFVTWRDEVYYLDGTGCMAIGWIGFTDDMPVKTVDKNIEEHDNVVEAFGLVQDEDDNDIFELVFEDNETYETMWCYFDGSGVLAMDEWYKAWDLHYYSAGAFCIMDNYRVAIDSNKDDDMNDSADGYYGFGVEGNMLVGWNSLNYVSDGGSDDTDAGTPFEGAGDAEKTTNSWTYYKSNGLQVDLGWEKIEGHWTYFVAADDNQVDDDDRIGIVLLTDTLITDGTTDTAGTYEDGDPIFYVDANGYMVTGAITFTGKKNLTIAKDNVKDGEVEWADEYYITVKGETDSYYFDTENGGMVYGLVGRYYYNAVGVADVDAVYAANNSDVVTGNTITFGTAVDGYKKGEKINGDNFFLVTLNDDDETVVMYFESGKLIQNEAIKFGNIVIAIKDGYVCTDAVGEEIKVDGVTYEFTDETYIKVDDITINGLTR